MTLSNNWITGLGALLAVLQYLQGVGAKAPTTKWEWLQTAIAAGIAGLGFYLKSLTVSTKTPVILLALALSGCAPANFFCAGKGTVTATAMLYNATTQFDCGDGAMFSKGDKSLPLPPKLAPKP